MEMDQVYSEAGSSRLGKVEIAPEVIQIIAGLAAIQVEGVAGTSGGVVSDITQFLGRKKPKQGIKVELEEEVKIFVSLILHYGYPIPDVGREVQEQVKTAVETMTGLSVSAVTVRVVEVRLKGEERAAGEQEAASQRLK
ncbi:putative alkaline shock family protein YloU [Melghirimyces profundicolus]|uniref:Putative alkaline shock family protein YloU n=1 Tax=Melghirimyces profundicolus TaxID=1242148 RepID=A0A2T6BCY1_9BACL|nr:Asp23/Gls24 family envelope stress response protein [Melghirimyces profundicolus]PTX53925.1 putative alkaline shock family protein YloU [Melghirimyces profundicolus]